jgi:hypothetical protein
MSDAVDEISRIVKNASRDAYERGWNDAMAAVAKAAQGMKPLDSLSAEAPAKPSAEISIIPTIPIIPRTNGRPASKAIQVVEDCITQSPGKKGVDVVKAAQLVDPTINERTARTCLRRLKLSKKIWQRNSLWYPKPRPRPGNENEEAISSPPHH